MVTAGSTLRQLREKLGLTMRDVETASEKLARKRGNVGYFVPISRLSDVETKGITPSIYRLYSLAIIYHSDFRHMLRLYGVEMDLEVSDLEVTAPPKSHLSHALSNIEQVHVPVRMDPSFDPRKTLNFGRMIEQWGTVPLKYLEQLSKKWIHLWLCRQRGFDYVSHSPSRQLHTGGRIEEPGIGRWVEFRIRAPDLFRGNSRQSHLLLVHDYRRQDYSSATPFVAGRAADSAVSSGCRGDRSSGGRCLKTWGVAFDFRFRSRPKRACSTELR